MPYPISQADRAQHKKSSQKIIAWVTLPMFRGLAIALENGAKDFEVPAGCRRHR
jgi:hypothetical protein